MKRALAIALLLAGCADGKSALTVRLTSDGMIDGIDHFAVTVTEQTTPPLSVGPFDVAPSGSTIPPVQTFALAFDREVRASVEVAVTAIDATNAPLSAATGMIAIVPGQSEDLTISLPGATSGDGGAGDASSDASSAPDLLPPPGCPTSDDGGVFGDPCTAPAQHACYAGPAGTCGIGQCRPGVQHCVDGAWGPCLGEVDPQLEVCNGRDEDCNGVADDGLGTVSCGLGECAVTVNACTAGKPTVCTPKNGVAETCDGKDNDCNGAIDEIVGTGNCSCVYVAPSGNDSTGSGTLAAPLKTIAAGIAKAQITGQPKQVCVASGASCPSSATYVESVSMVDGIHVYGGYESSNWTWSPSSCVVTIAPNGSVPGVAFDVNIVHPTILSGFSVSGTPGVSVVGSKGAVIAGVAAYSGSGTSAAFDVKDFNMVPATPLITRSRSTSGSARGIRSTNSKPIIYGNCTTTRDSQGHCPAQTGCAVGGNANLSSFYDTVSIELDQSPGAVVAENEMCGATGILITGDATGTLIRGNSITPYTNGTGYGINAGGCNNTSPWIFDNLLINAGVDNYMGNMPPTAYGIVAGGGCHLRIDHNVEIDGLETAGTQDSTAIWCQRDNVSLRESRCQIVGNKITGAKAPVGNAAYGIRCDDVSCARIEDNQIVGGVSNLSSGIVLKRSGSLIARNTIDSGCGGTGGVSVGIDASDSFARIENNLIKGGACGSQTWGVRVHLVNSTDEVDLHSNNIFGGGVVAGCTARAVSFDVGATSPSGPRGLLRNNILSATTCGAGNGFDVAELSAMASPRILENDDFAPASSLYHSNASGDLTLMQIKQLPGSSGSFSADPMLASDNIHLQSGSMCIGTGTTDGAPPDDYFGTPRGATPDVGMNQK